MIYKILVHLVYYFIFFGKFSSSWPVDTEFTRKPKANAKHLDYSYDQHDIVGPSNWPGLCCQGHRQSPIEITNYDYIKKVSYPTLNITGAIDKNPTSVNVLNNGHGATISFIYSDNSLIKITGGPLGKDVYNFVDFHMHWPCEHTFVMSDTCALEIHLVHFNAKYETFKNALDKEDGLAVIGILLLLSNTAKPLPFVPLLQKVRITNTTHIESDPKNVFNYRDVIRSKSVPRIYSYKGSLTTPACGKFKLLFKIHKINI